MSERSGVEIDYCPECRGVWLDRGELDKLIARSVTSTPGFSDTEYSDPKFGGQKGDYYKKKRKESFLGDLFDF